MFFIGYIGRMNDSRFSNILLILEQENIGAFPLNGKVVCSPPVGSYVVQTNQEPSFRLPS